MTLERQVDPPPPTTVATAGRMALSCLVGATAVAIAFAARPRDTPPLAPAPTPAAPPHITVMAPPPIVVSMETIVQSPITPPLVADTIGCPTLPSVDEPIGKPVAPRALERNDPRATVKSASSAPVLAVQAGRDVWVSEDDGRAWSRAFAGHDVETIAVAPDGTVYAREGLTIGVRARGGKVAWRPFLSECAEDARCSITIGALGSEVVAFIDDRIRTSSDRGRTWKDVTNKDVLWEARDNADLYAFRGALYQVSHYVDMCGVDDYDTYRFDTKHRVSHDVFHNYYNDTDEPMLEPANDVDAVWTWAQTCRVIDDAAGRCRNRDPARRALMEAAMLAPREGARALSLYRGSLIELCPAGVRQVYRAFPFDHLDAVDASGRALVMNGGDLLRWSPSAGWRKLRTFEVSPAAADGE